MKRAESAYYMVMIYSICCLSSHRGAVLQLSQAAVTCYSQGVGGGAGVGGGDILSVSKPEWL